MPAAAYSVACPGTFATLGIPLVDGREFTSRDSLERPAVAVINRRFAREIWPGEQAVGKRFKIGFLDSDNPWMTVVGVVENFRHGGLDVEQQPVVLPAVSPGGVAGDEHRGQDGVRARAAGAADHQGRRRGRAEPAGVRRADDGDGARGTR